jgi:hypothetical protein
VLKSDANHPFFRPLWRRVAIFVVCLAWAVLEFYGGSREWGVIALAFAGYAAYAYLFRYSPPDENKSPPTEEE